MFTPAAFEFYQAGESPIHKLDPRVKLLSTVGLILSNVLLPDGAWLAYLASFLVVTGFSALARIRFSFVLKRSLLAIPFALAAFTIIFTLPGEPLTQFSLGSWDLTISDAGLVRFLSILVRSWISLQAAILLTAATKFSDLAHGLRHLRVPLILIAIISFMYRYLFVLGEEVERLLQARAARSARLPGGKKPSVLWRARVAGNMVGQLFLRSYERSDRVYNAMVARGFRGSFLTFTPHTMQRHDWIALLIFCLILAGLQISANILM
ncbi:MAG: cobalt ECF transporter T component CbiQ [Chloroflexota bacterium]